MLFLPGKGLLQPFRTNKHLSFAVPSPMNKLQNVFIFFFANQQANPALTHVALCTALPI
jgi:hypothetical protein